jgi:hypothetical protein
VFTFPQPRLVRMSLPNLNSTRDRPGRTHWGWISPTLPIVGALEVGVLGFLCFTGIGGWVLLQLIAEVLVVGLLFLLLSPRFFLPRDLRFTEHALIIEGRRKSITVPWQDVMVPVYRYGPFGGVLAVRSTELDPRGRPRTSGWGLTRDQYAGIVEWIRTHGKARAG